MNCVTCNTSIIGNFCSHCGRPAKMTRIDWSYMVHEIQHVMHFEKGISYTVKALLREPGTSIQAFIREDRSRLVKPVLFIIVTSLIYTTITHLFHIEQEYISYHEATVSTTGVIFNWIQGHYGYANILMGIFIACWLKILYRSFQYNFFEMLILLCFAMGMDMLIFSIFALFEGLTGLQVMGIAGVAGVGYCCWAIGHFFQGDSITSYGKALVAYVLGMATFSLAVLVAGTLIDLLGV